MKRKTPTSEKVRRPRNPLAFAPLMRKGGVHQRSIGGERLIARRATERMARGGKRPEED